MAIQYYMRGYNTVAHTGAPIGHVDWVVNDVPDSTATFVTTVNANYVPAEISNVIVNRIVQSKVDNFLKPNESVTGTGADGYWLHVNAYDWLNRSPLSPPPNPPIDPPSQVTGFAIVRGTTSGTIPNDFSTLLWDEVNNTWKFALNTNGDGVTVGALQDVALGALAMNGPLTIGSPASHTGLIRLPSNQADGTGNTGAIKSRNADDSDDITLIQADSGNRVQLGSIFDPIYVPSSLRVDNYILASFDPTDTLVSQSGFIRNPNATTIITARTTSLSDINLLATDSSNNILIGNGNANTIVFNDALGTYVFQNNGALNFKVQPANASFDSSINNPFFSQDTITNNGGTGKILTIQAQNVLGTSTTGGALNLTSGTGTTVGGNVNVQTGGVTRLIVSPLAVTQETPTYSFGGTGDLTSVTNPTIKQNNLNVASTAGNTLTVQAQNSVGATSVGGILKLTSGTGTSGAGNVQIQTGGVDQIIVTPTKVTITGNLEVQGTTTTIDSTIVDIIGRVIHANWSDPAIPANANTPVPSQIAGYTIHRGNAAGVPRDSASLMWTEGVLNSGADGYWRATTYTGDGYGTDGYTIGSGGIASLAIMARNFTVVDPTPNPVAGSLPGIGGLRTQKNTVAVSSRNLASTLDLILLGTDNSNRIIHGDVNNSSHLFNTSAGSVYDFQVNGASNKIMIGDGYIRSGITPALTGIFRNTQAPSILNPIVNSRNFSNTLDMVLLGTDGYDRVVHGGAAVNTGHIFNTSPGSVYDFQVSSASNKIMIGDGYIRAGATPSTIGVFRNTQTPSVNNPIVASRNFANSLDLVLLSTDGYDRIVHGDTSNKAQIFDTTIDGYHDFRANSSSTLLVDGYKVAFQKGRRRHITPVSAIYQVLVTDDYLAINAGASYPITMPASPTLGDAYEFKDINGTASINNITINGGGPLIDGTPTFVMNTNYASFVLTYTGAAWSVS